jgi:hypothetical protein
MRLILSVCCARAASVYAAAPPARVMKSQRLMCSLCPRIAPYHTTAGNAVLCITAFWPTRLPQRVILDVFPIETAPRGMSAAPFKS